MKTSTIYTLVILFLTAVTFTDCSLQKRVYNRGYYVSWKKAPVKKDTRVQAQKDPERPIEEQRLAKGVNSIEAAKQEEGLTAYALQGSHNLQSLHIYPLPSLSDSCGDRLTFRNGDEVMVKVYDVGPDHIKFKPCDNLEGPLRTVSKEKIFMIRYVNGTKEVFQLKPKLVNDQQELTQNKTYMSKPYASRTSQPHEPAKVNGFAVAGFVLSLFSWTILLAPLALIFGAIGVSQCDKYPEKYYGKGFAVAAVIITLIIGILLLLAFSV